MKERAQVAQVEHGASGAELNDDMDLTIAPNSAPELTQTNTNTIQTNDPMDVDVADPATLNTVVARYLYAHVTSARPRNWGIDQLTIFTDEYEATTGLNSTMKAFYKTMHAKTGVIERTIRRYLSAIRAQTTDNETDATARIVATHFYREDKSWTKNEDDELITKHRLTSNSLLVKDITINARSQRSIEQRMTHLIKLGRLARAERRPGRNQQLAIDLNNQLARQHRHHPANDGASLNRALRDATANDATHTRINKQRALRQHPMKYVAQQALLCNYDLPFQRLDYDTKTPLLTPSQRDPQTTGQPDAIGPSLPGPLPPNAAYDLYKREAWIPTRWRFAVASSNIHLPGIAPNQLAYDYALEDVQRSTTIKQITDNIHDWLMNSSAKVAKAAKGTEILLQIVDPTTFERTTLAPDATAETTDLFNEMSNVIITI